MQGKFLRSQWIKNHRDRRWGHCAIFGVKNRENFLSIFWNWCKYLLSQFLTRNSNMMLVFLLENSENHKKCRFISHNVMITWQVLGKSSHRLWENSRSYEHKRFCSDLALSWPYLPLTTSNSWLGLENTLIPFTSWYKKHLYRRCLSSTTTV